LHIASSTSAIHCGLTLMKIVLILPLKASIRAIDALAKETETHDAA